MAVAGALRSRPGLNLWRDLALRTGSTQHQPPSQICIWQRHRVQARFESMSAARRGALRERRNASKGRDQEKGRRQDTSDQDFLVPGIFVRPPLIRFASSPKFFWFWIVTRLRDAATNFLFSIGSKPTWLTRALFKPENRKLVPTAKAMHRAMYEAIAKGDKDSVRNICSAAFADRLSAAIDGRPPGRRYTWELVRYCKPWIYPRVVDQKLAVMPKDPMRPQYSPPSIRQVIVAIDSVQRRVEHDWTKAGGGKVVPGSEKEMRVLEYVVLQRTVDRNTWVQGDWKVLALTKETTPEQFFEGRALMKEAEKAMVKDQDRKLV